MVPNVSFGSCLHSFRASHQNHDVTSVAASVSTLLASLANVARGALLTPNKKKGSGKPSRHPEPKLCDSVVTGLADSIR